MMMTIIHDAHQHDHDGDDKNDNKAPRHTLPGAAAAVARSGPACRTRPSGWGGGRSCSHRATGTTGTSTYQLVVRHIERGEYLPVHMRHSPLGPMQWANAAPSPKASVWSQSRSSVRRVTRHHHHHHHHHQQQHHHHHHHHHHRRDNAIPARPWHPLPGGPPRRTHPALPNPEGEAGEEG
jgi:hypothetical protein